MVLQFAALDYVVFIAFFTVSMAIGLYFGYVGRRTESTDQYLMGGRKMTVLPVCLSLIVSIFSSSGILGNAAEMYVYGSMILFATINILLGCVIVTMVIVPLFYPLGVISVNEYLERRFKSRSVKLFGTFAFLLNSTLYVGTVIYGPATSLNIATGAPAWVSVLVVSVVGSAYTSVGGIKGVIWTDVFQSFIMISGLIAINILGIWKVGGVNNVWRINDEWGRFFIDYEVDITKRLTLLSMLMGNTNYWTALFAVNQPCVQRFCALNTLNKARLSVLLNGPGCVILLLMASLTGMVAFAYYTQTGCDPIRAKILSNQNQILPYFVMDVLSYPGLPGIFISSLFSAALSTLSSSINSMAAVTWEDVLKPHYSHWSNKQQATINKLLVFVYGLLCMFVSYLVLAVGGNLVQIVTSFFGATIGPIFGLFLLGAAIPWANWKGALIGGVTSLLVLLWLMFGQVFTKLQRTSLPSPTDNCYLNDYVMFNTTQYSWNTTTILNTLNTTAQIPEHQLSIRNGLEYFYSISYSWFSLIGVTIVLVVGGIASFVSGFDDPNQNDPDLYFSFLRCLVTKKKNSTEKNSEEETFIKLRTTNV